MNRELRKETYRRNILAGIHRVLTELDRDPFSITYGSFDREYWAWATKDFSNIDLQRAVYPLTLVYLNNFTGNVWYRQPRVKDWILAGVDFWGKSQHKDGSFDHHYPLEHSFVGAAFTLYEISQAFIALDKDKLLEPRERGSWLTIMVKAAEFLCRNDELHGFISNHRAGAACALYSMFLIAGEEKYKARAYFFINSIINKMSKAEGWLCEYDGADPGYQTLDTYYLANFYRLSFDNRLLNEVIIPSLKFLIYFFHPDGSVGGEYGSRNCPLYFPGGFEILGGILPEAEAIARIGAYGIEQGNSPALMSHDIRNFVPMLSCYAQAFLACLDGKGIEPSQMPFEREFERYWADAGIFIRSDARLHFIVGCSKGGVVKVFDKIDKRLVCSHAGYQIELMKGKFYSNQFLIPATVNGVPECTGKEAKIEEIRRISFSHPFFSVISRRVMAPLSFLSFRLFNLTLGRIKLLNNWFRRKVITAIFIRRRVKSGLSIKRSMVFSQDILKITDYFQGLKSKTLKSIRACDFFTTIYMGSSKYYRHSEKLKDELSRVNLLKYAQEGGNLTVSYKLDTSGIGLVPDAAAGPKRIEDVADYWNRNPVHSVEFDLSSDLKSYCDYIDALRWSDNERWAREKFYEFKGKEGARILDAGCGIGVFSRFYARKWPDFKVYAIDISSESVRITRKSFEIFGLQGEIKLGSVEEIPYPDEYFDYIVSNGVIHHTPNTERAVAEFYRVLKPGGLASVCIYYRNMFLRQPMWEFTKLLLPVVLKNRKGRERFLSAGTPEEFVRVYDGNNTPISKVYSRKQADELFRRFKRIAVEPHYFPIRFLRAFKSGGLMHKILDSYCGALIYYLLEKPKGEKL